MSCLPCERWARYWAVLDGDVWPLTAEMRALKCEPCPEHDGWTFADVARDLWSRDGQVAPMTVGAVLRGNR